jgi:hypothetical protein
MGNIFKADFIDNNSPIAVIGGTNSGKTNLGFYIGSLRKGKKYLLGYPREVGGWIRLNSQDDFSKIVATDEEPATLLIDEFSKYFAVWDKRSNEKLLEVLQFAEHNKIKLILTTQLSQFITKQCEAMIPCWAIKQINIRRLKNGSTPSYVLKYAIKHPNISREFVKIAVKEFIWYSENSIVGENGIYEFPFMNIGKDWGNTDKISEKNTEENPEKKNKYPVGVG